MRACGQAPCTSLKLIYQLCVSVPHVSLSVSAQVNAESGLVDYDKLEEQAFTFRPKIIVCGASAYSREVREPTALATLAMGVGGRRV